MRTKATRKDFYREIQKSFGRFMSIFLIVALGVAFFSGIRAAEPSLRKTADSYYDNSKLMDIKTISTLGITKEDIQAFDKVEGVKKAQGAYSADFLCGENEEQVAVHVMSLSNNMNLITAETGRLPEKKGECVADDTLGFKIGDTITVKSGDDGKVTDTLKTDTLKVVGIGSTPYYISFGRGSTSIGTGSLSGFIGVTESTFALNVYTEAYIEAAGAKELTAYTKEYEDKVDVVMKRVKKQAKERGVLRKEAILDDAEQTLEDGRTTAEQELTKAKQTLTEGDTQLADAKAQLADGRAKMEGAQTTLVSKQKELEEAKAQYESGNQQLQDGKAAYQQAKEQYEQQAATFAQQEQQVQIKFQGERAKLDTLSGQCVQMERQSSNMEESPEKEELEKQLAIMREQLLQGEQVYQVAKERADAELLAYRQQLDTGGAQLAESEAQMNVSETQLAQAQTQIRSGQSQMAAGWRELKKQEATLDSGEQELTEKEAELKDGKQKYEEERAKAEKELADGQRELSKIKDPKWYTYDRSTLPEYTGLGENADRMKAIGRVFPIVFFLVAALISLTTMTRMVEEQRVEIGTMKALGYSQKTIAGKYLAYALLATFGGSIFGVLLGEKILPYIIIYAYQIMYLHLPEILVPYHWGYALVATFAAVACTMVATLSACRRELSDHPAILMRPPAPKKGTRVFLEHVPFIWKHLNFIWKSTVRNLMRYKKRFFMTIIGIGGSMALMLVGFGLKDSIMNIGGLQYGQIQTYDGMALLQEDITAEERSDLQTMLEHEKQVERFMDVSMKNITLVKGKKERDSYQCIPKTPANMKEYSNFQSRTSEETYTLSDKGAIITEKTAKLLDANVGDTIYIKDEDRGNMPVKIAAICENYMGHYIYFTPNTYKEIYGEDPEYNSTYYKTKVKAKQDLERIGQKILAEDGVLNVSYLHDIEKQLDDMLQSLDLVIGVLIISAGMLAFVVLYNLNNVNITERQRELATIKVLGFYDQELAAYVYRENILLTLLGAVAGMGIGRLLHLFVINTVEVDNVMFGRNINFPSFLYSLLFTLAFSAIVNWVMYFKLKKIDMVESLKSIE